MFHYRESRGPEVDLLAQGSAGWIFAEAKSGATLDPSFFKAMVELETRFPAGTVIHKRLIHGGDSSRIQQGVAVTDWTQVQAAAW
ncbi:MAG: hypothetical protein JST24_00075 [Acidobacteria bacterium]|nr:hypothetical protein [Acidobacteriota bacterium]